MKCFTFIQTKGSCISVLIHWIQWWILFTFMSFVLACFYRSCLATCFSIINNCWSEEHVRLDFERWRESDCTWAESSESITDGKHTLSFQCFFPCMDTSKINIFFVCFHRLFIFPSPLCLLSVCIFIIILFSSLSSICY